MTKVNEHGVLIAAWRERQRLRLGVDHERRRWRRHGIWTTSKIQYKARTMLPAVIEIPSDCTLEEYLTVLNGRKIRVSI